MRGHSSHPQAAEVVSKFRIPGVPGAGNLTMGVGACVAAEEGILFAYRAQHTATLPGKTPVIPAKAGIQSCRLLALILNQRATIALLHYDTIPACAIVGMGQGVPLLFASSVLMWYTLCDGIDQT